MSFACRVLVNLVAVSCLLLPQSARAAASQELEKKVDQVFAQWNRSDSPGCALAVARRGRILYTRGYGMADLEQGVAITPGTAFYVGSVSKQFTAMAIALLAEEGKLGLDDDVRHYIPELPHYGNVITIRHLIHHISGLRDYLALMSLSGRSFADSISDPEVVDLIARQKELNFRPGSRFLYSNSGYFLMAEIVKRVTGGSLREYAEEKMFAPLGMRRSHFHDRAEHIVPYRAEGHRRLGEGEWGLIHSRFALVGSGGLYTTVEDLIKWDENFYRNRMGLGGQDLIDRVQTPGRLNSGAELDYAFGLFIGEYRGLPTVSHGGALGGYRAHLLRFPQQHFSVAIECNFDAINPGPLALAVADLYLADEMAPKPQEAPAETGDQESPPSPEQEPLSDAQKRAYAGAHFSLELDTAYHIELKDGGLVLRVGYRPPRPLKHVGDDRFVTDDGLELEFQRNDEGEVTGFILQGFRVRNLRFEKQE